MAVRSLLTDYDAAVAERDDAYRIADRIRRHAYAGLAVHCQRIEQVARGGFSCLFGPFVADEKLVNAERCDSAILTMLNSIALFCK